MTRKVTSRFVLQGDNQLNSAFAKARTQMNQLAKRAVLFGAAMAAGVAVAVRTQAQYIDTLAKTADVIGVSVEALQELRFAAELAGISNAGLDDSLRRMGRRLGEFANSGAGPAEKALKRLNLENSITPELLNDSEKSFITIVKAMQDVESITQQSALAAQLFGDDFGPKLVPFINQGVEGIEAARKAFRELHGTLTDIDVAGVERMNDEVAKARLVGEGLARQYTAALAPAIAAIAENFTNSARESGGFRDKAVDSAETTVKAFAFVADAIEGIRRTFQIWGRSLAVVMASMELGVWQFANSLINGPGAALDWLIEKANSIPGVDVDFKFGVAVPELQRQMDRAAGIVREGVGDIQGILMAPMPGDALVKDFERMRKELEASAANGDTEVVVNPTVNPEGVEEFLAKLRTQAATFNLDPIEQQLFELSQMEGVTPEALDSARQMLEFIRDSGIATDEFAEKQTAAAAVFAATRTPLEEFNAEMERLNELKNTFVGGEPLIDEETFSRAKEAAQDALDQSQQTFSQMDEFAKQAARNMQDAFAQFLVDPFNDGLDDMLSNFLRTMQQMVAEVASQQILRAIFGGFAGSDNPFLSALGSAFGAEPKALGGPVSGGSPYLVGERGPELFVPGSSGNIVPNHAMGGGSVTVNIDARESNDPGRLLSLVPVIQSQIEQSMALKMRRGYL